MKQIIHTALALCLTLSACSKHKDEPIKSLDNHLVAPQPITENNQSAPDPEKIQDNAEGKQQDTPEAGKQDDNKATNPDEQAKDKGKDKANEKPGDKVDDASKSKDIAPIPPTSNKRPEDLDLGLRTVGQWRVDKATYLDQFDFEALYLNNNKARFTTDYLKQFVRFQAVRVDGTGGVYTLTDADLKHLSIVDIAFEATSASSGHITFYTAYKGVKSSNKTMLPFDHTAYYDAKVKPNTQAIAHRYLLGVSKYPGVFYGSLLDYDSNKYRLLLVEHSAQADLSSNVLHCTLILEHSTTGKRLAELHKTIKGFKPLSKLQNELQLSSSYELLEEMRKRVNRYKSEKMRLEVLRSTMPIWRKTLQIAIKDSHRGLTQLYWDKVRDSYHQEVDAMLAGQNAAELDLYFESPIFELQSIRIDGEDLYLHIKLSEVNGQSVSVEQVVFVKGGAKK